MRGRCPAASIHPWPGPSLGPPESLELRVRAGGPLQGGEEAGDKAPDTVLPWGYGTAALAWVLRGHPAMRPGSQRP